MTSKGIRRLQAFSSAIRSNICAAFYHIQLTACSRGPSATAGLLVNFDESRHIIEMGEATRLKSDEQIKHRKDDMNDTTVSVCLFPLLSFSHYAVNCVTN